MHCKVSSVSPEMLKKKNVNQLISVHVPAGGKRWRDLKPLRRGDIDFTFICIA